jgi:6-methylsalicylate decarboxylase
VAPRIDTHHHIVPPVWTAALREHSYFGGQPTPHWSPELALDVMGELDIVTAVTSVGRPGVFLGDAAEAVVLARAVNEFSAGLARDHPGRFGFFASLPLPDVDASLREIGYAFDVLNANGVIMLSSVAGTYVGDPAWDPVMAELARRDAVIFVHPTAPAGPPVPGVPPFVADFLLDTTRAAVNLVRHGVTARYPSLRIILSHAGGFVPYAAARVASLAEVADGAQPAREDFLSSLRGFWFDTALSASPYTLPALLSFAAAGRVLFGSDWPYARGDNHAYFTDQLDQYPLDAGTRAAINGANAAALLGLPFPAPANGGARWAPGSAPARRAETDTAR